MCILIEGMAREERKNEAITRAKKKLCEWCLKNAHEDLSCVANFKIAPAWPRIEGNKEERERAYLVRLKLLDLLCDRAIRANHKIGHDEAVLDFQGQKKAYVYALRLAEKALAN